MSNSLEYLQSPSLISNFDDLSVPNKKDLKFESAPVESPIKGIVGRVYVDIGQQVTEETPVALVLNLDRVKIDLNIPRFFNNSVLRQAKVIWCHRIGKNLWRGGLDFGMDNKLVLSSG